jgi:peptidyl-prolyl cis-trans isomerase C
MLRPALLVFGLSCAMACTSYGQQPSSTSTAPPKPAGQTTANGSEKAAEAKTPPASNVPMSEPVITLKGACPAKNGGTPEGCTKALTREQFEKLTDALQPAEKGPVPPEMRRRFATEYAKLLVMSDAAREMGLENDPKVKEIFSVVRNQVLAQALNQHLMEEYAHPSDQQVQEYYDKNAKKYHEATLQRIIIPVVQNNPEKPAKSPEEQKAFAEKIRTRYAAGEDAAKLEKESMEFAGMTNSNPDVNVGARRPGSLPEAHEGVFDMKAGEVSPVYSDPSAFYIYKVVSERQVPLSEVKNQIEQAIQRQEYNDKIEQIKASVTAELNDAYFGPEPPPSAAPGRPGMPGRPFPGGPPAGAGVPPSHGATPPPAPAAGATPPPAPAQSAGSSPK